MLVVPLAASSIVPFLSLFVDAPGQKQNLITSRCHLCVAIRPDHHCPTKYYQQPRYPKRKKHVISLNARHFVHVHVHVRVLTSSKCHRRFTTISLLSLSPAISKASSRALDSHSVLHAEAPRSCSNRKYGNIDGQPTRSISKKALFRGCYHSCCALWFVQEARFPAVHLSILLLSIHVLIPGRLSITTHHRKYNPPSLFYQRLDDLHPAHQKPPI